LKKLTWRELNHTLGTKTEAEVLDMLNEERADLRRIVVLERLHQRYNSLRVTRERIELFKEATTKWKRS
jgi:predicted type IV restriction endonuclease